MFSAKIIYNFRILLMACCLSVVPFKAFGAESPIYIEADHMASTENNNAVLFTGNVDAKQGDLRIRSDEMTVYYTDNKNQGGDKQAGAKQQVEKLICDGNVEITRDDWLGTSDTMTYLSEKRQVILTGNAKAWQDQNMVGGEKIIYYMDEGRSEIIGGTSVTVGGEQKQEKKARVKMRILQK
jgi:lipopolysaccharide export system protein LptA